MKILHVSYHDNKGGAALAAFRLCIAQRAAGMNAEMLCIEKHSHEDFVHLLHPAGGIQMRRLYQKTESAVTRLLADKRNFMPKSLNLLASGILREIAQRHPDLVHLHWIHGGMCSLREIADIDYPTVWTLHDTWAYCGCEHHHLAGDLRFQYGYADHSLEAVLWRMKHNLWQNFHPVLAGPSRWITGEAKQSKLFSGCQIQRIANGIPLNDFSRVPRREARRRWGIDEQIPLIVTGAASLNDVNKCGPLLMRTLAALLDTAVLAIGEPSTPKWPGKVFFTGNLSSASELAAAYSAGNVFLSAAAYDNLPNMLIESIACGTPVVAAAAGGVADIACGKNGVTVPATPQALFTALQSILCGERNFEPSAEMFSDEGMVREYSALYATIQ